MKIINVDIRQGDVMLIRVDALPDSANAVTGKDKVILAVGEATGHAHVIELERGVELYEAKDGSRYLTVADEVEAWLRHTGPGRPDHAPLPVQPGTYLITRPVTETGDKWVLGQQREYSPQRIIRLAD